MRLATNTHTHTQKHFYELLVDEMHVGKFLNEQSTESCGPIFT